MKRKAFASTFLLVLLVLVVAGIGFINKAEANPMNGPPLPYLPVITIGSDGSISPANASISKTGTTYTLTGNIINCSIEIQCNNITIDGAGFTLQTLLPYEYAPSPGITISSNGITVQNMKIPGHVTGILILGSHNTIFQNNIGSGIEIRGNYNNIKRNTIANAHDSAIYLGGNYNNIVGNFMHGHGIFMAGSIIDKSDTPDFNSIIGNTIEDCPYALYLSTGNNIFYFNNFINSTNGNVSAFRWEMAQNGWTGVYPNDTRFDNNAIGNYWSDYDGIDTNNDGIGDTPYKIGGNLQDRYPLITPFDISSASLEFPQQDWSPQLPSTQSSPSPLETPSTSALASEHQQSQPFPILPIATASGALTAVFVGAGLLVYFKKHRGSRNL